MISHIMKQQTDRVSLQSPFRRISVWVFHLLLTHSCRGDSQVIGPCQSIVAGVGDDVILPCYLKPAMDVTKETIEWRRSDLESGLVYVRRDGRDLENERHLWYRGRTSLFTDELKRGNFSLKLSNVQLTDQATYECDIPLQQKNSSVQLVVDDFFNVQSSSAPISTGFIVGLAVCILLVLSLILLVLKQKGKINKVKRSCSDETDNREKKNRTNRNEDQSVTEERETEQLMTAPTVKMRVSNTEENKKNKHSEDKQQRMMEQIKELETEITQLEEREKAADMKWKETNDELTETQSRLKSKEEENNMLKKQVDQLSADNRKLREEKQSREKELKELKVELEIKKKELAQKQRSWFTWGSGSS